MIPGGALFLPRTKARRIRTVPLAICHDLSRTPTAAGQILCDDRRQMTCARTICPVASMVLRKVHVFPDEASAHRLGAGGLRRQTLSLQY